MVLRRWSLEVCALLLSAAPLAGQSALEGFVKGKDGKPLGGAKVVMTRLDVHRSYDIKTDKKGYYYYSNLPLGFYSVTVQVDGNDVTGVTGIRTQGGNPLLINFDLGLGPQEQENIVRQQLKKAGAEWSYLKIMPMAAAQAAPAPEATSPGAAPAAPAAGRALTPEEKAALDKQIADRAAQIKARDDTNQAFTQGLNALQAKQWDEAAALLTKAAELAPKEAAIWADLGAAYTGMGASKSGSEFEQAMQKGFEAYAKSVELAPGDASTHYSYAMALARGRKVDETWAEAKKYAALEPAGAYRIYLNIGKTMTNNGQSAPAQEAFRLAIAAAPEEPGNAESYYQYGVALMSGAQVGSDGKIVPAPGTAEALRKYLQLAPEGPNAAAARDLLNSLGAPVQLNLTEQKATKKKK